MTHKCTFAHITSEKRNKSDTTRACSIYLIAVAIERLHVSAFLHLSYHQVVSSVCRVSYLDSHIHGWGPTVVNNHELTT